MIDLGVVKPGSTIRIPFGSYTGSTGASSATSNYAAADILVYKDGSTTERASTAGFTATTTFDTVTGINLCTIDLSDNTTAGFWASGSEYFVIIGPVTVDSQTVNFPIARFVMGIRGSCLDTTIATLASQTSFTLTSGPAEDSALLGCVAYIHDVASAVQGGFAVVSAYTGATKTVTLTAGPSYTAAATDNISFFPPVNDHWFNALRTSALPLTPTVAGRTLDVSAGGEAGLDWANVGSPTTSLALTGTTIAVTQKVDVDTIKTNPVVNGGTITFPTTATLASTTNITAGTITTATNVTTVNGLAANVITAASINADAITAAKIADGAIDAATFAAGAINAAAIAAAAFTSAKFGTGAIDAAALATDAAQEIRDSVWSNVLAELTVDPTATPTAKDALMLGYMAQRNARTTTASADTIKNDAGTTILTATVSDDGTTFTKAKYA